ncbi:hypothetical protein [uncultured Eubacterium sp.]|uniref:hypothetical protein n=1 Tax=uncultured Eubacterium sp. TaxID=165185 RepID=UPI0025F54404|nr:hypothetical protein [uncultured Eubacterium sp.]
MYKYINNGYIIGVGTGAGAGEPITENEYNTILDKINNRPTAPEGFTYRLTTALEWELVELPPIVENNEEFEEDV